MSGFSNAILGGASKLIREAIRSPNYAAGATGWTVDQSGFAEFNDLTVRGTLIVQSSDQGVFVYRGTPAAGTLIVALAAADGTDAYGNTYTRGLWVAGFEVGGFSNQIALTPPSPAGTAYNHAEIFAQVDAADAADLFLIGPNDANTGASFAYISMRGANPADGDTASITLDCNETQVSGDLSIAGTLTGPAVAGSAYAAQSANDTSTSTSYVGGTTHGASFVAPASGAVWIEFGGLIGSNVTSVGLASLLSDRVRTGAVVGSGTNVLSPDDGRAIKLYKQTTSGTFAYVPGAIKHQVTGLTPGDSYNVATVFRAVASTAAVLDRWLCVAPVI